MGGGWGRPGRRGGGARGRGRGGRRRRAPNPVPSGSPTAPAVGLSSSGGGRSGSGKAAQFREGSRRAAARRHPARAFPAATMPKRKVSSAEGAAKEEVMLLLLFRNLLQKWKRSRKRQQRSVGRSLALQSSEEARLISLALRSCWIITKFVLVK
nr:non-histone chromosomal protein HMG-14 isoform X3 [Gorilla gorilla gorilla]